MVMPGTRYEGSEEFSWQPYRVRPFPVWAMRMNVDFECQTLEGSLKGKSGDWIVRADDGQQYPVPDFVFRRYYIKREWGNSNAPQNKQSQSLDGKSAAQISQDSGKTSTKNQSGTPV